MIRSCMTRAVFTALTTSPDVKLDQLALFRSHRLAYTLENYILDGKPELRLEPALTCAYSLDVPKLSELYFAVIH
jgi:hypothetical protein